MDPKGGAGPSPVRGDVKRTAAGWEASFGDRLVVGVYATEELAQRTLDILHLKAATDSRKPIEEVELRLPLEGYLDEQTMAELRSFDLAAVLGAVRSYAIGGVRAPRCGVLEVLPAAAGDGRNGGQHPQDAADAIKDGYDGEYGHYRGITRDSNGRHQYWIALLYASLDKHKRPVPPNQQQGKTSLYIACLRSAHEAAVAHDLAVVWWRLGNSYAHLWREVEGGGAATGGHEQRQGEEAGQAYRGTEQQQAQQQAGSLPQQAGYVLQQVQQQRPPDDGFEDDNDDEEQWQEDTIGGGGFGREASDSGDTPLPAAVLPLDKMPAVVEWVPEKSVLKQLNFPPELYAGNQELMRQLLQSRTLSALRTLLSNMRNSGALVQLAAACRAAHPVPTLPHGALLPPAPARRRPRKPSASSGGGAAPPRQRPGATAGSPPPAVRERLAAGGGMEMGKHGRLHDKPYMGLVRDRQITLHPWRPMICALVAGHSKPQPRSLASCATAEEAAVARDLGWIWLWRRNLSLRQHASLNFSLQSYTELGGDLLDDIGQQQSLEGLRAYLRSMRDCGKLLSLAHALERVHGAPSGDGQRARPAPRGGGGAAAGVALTADGVIDGGLSAAGASDAAAGRTGAEEGGGVGDGWEEGEEGEALGAGAELAGDAELADDDDGAELAAEEMLHLLGGRGGGSGWEGGRGGEAVAAAAAPKRDRQKRQQAQHGGRAVAEWEGEEGVEEEVEEERVAKRQRGSHSRSPSYSSSGEGHGMESEEDAGAIEDPEDGDWQQADRRAAQRQQLQQSRARKRARVLPPPSAGLVDPGGWSGPAAAAAAAAIGEGQLEWHGKQQQLQGEQWAGAQRQHPQPPAAAAGVAAATIPPHAPTPALTPPAGQPPFVPFVKASNEQVLQPRGATPSPAPGFTPGSGGGSQPAARRGSSPAVHVNTSTSPPTPGFSRFVGVQRTASSKNASRCWIPRPTVRLMDGRRSVSKQLTLCYCDSAEEAAVARDLATLWSWEAAGREEHGTQQRLNFELAKYQSQPGLMYRLRSVPTTEAMQALAKSMRDSGALRHLAAAVGSSPAGASGGATGMGSGGPRGSMAGGRASGSPAAL